MRGFNETYGLVAVLNRERKPSRFLVDTFFPQSYYSTDQFIHFDELPYDIRIAAYVSPKVRTPLRERRGFKTKLFEPGYTKMRDPISGVNVMQRFPGETVGGELTAQQRLKLNMIEVMVNHRDANERRKTYQAVEIFRFGRVEVTSDNYPTRIVDYDRSTDLSVALTGGWRWGEVGIDPLDDVEMMMRRVRNKGGSRVTDVVLGTGAWEFLRKSERLEKLADLRRARPADVEFGPTQVGGDDEYAEHVGTFGGVSYWVYSEPYEDVDGEEKDFMPEFGVFFGSRYKPGIVARGAILDPAFGYMPLDIAPKRIEVEDPGGWDVLSQASPLLIPSSENSTACLEVWADES